MKDLLEKMNENMLFVKICVSVCDILVVLHFVFGISLIICIVILILTFVLMMEHSFIE